jgi:hypothetical protein
MIDGIWLYARHVGSNATITYAGLDSLNVVVAVHEPAAKLRNGKWDIDPFQPLRLVSPATTTGVRKRRLAFVSLDPYPTFGAAMNVIRDLKRRNICNVLIREAGILEGEPVNFPHGRDRALSIPALVLCGGSMGDAGFSGKLPPESPYE